MQGADGRLVLREEGRGRPEVDHRREGRQLVFSVALALGASNRGLRGRDGASLRTPRCTSRSATRAR
eukprot:1779455-Lingulodinium_polyedra.AAC.1